MGDNSLRYRKFKDNLFKVLVVLFALITTLPLIFILFYILKQGFSAISWQFLVSLPKPVGETGGGIANALVGTILIVLVASVLAIPVGIGAGIYLSEYKDSRLADWARSGLEVLNGTPSIVLGIMAYLLVVEPVGHFSAFSGSVALAFMMLPVVIRTTEETLKLMPDTLKEAALALGTPYYKVILKVILPSGASGIITGIMLSVARIAGETAPLLFTAFGSPFMNTNIFKATDSLPLLIFNYATSPYDNWHKLAWGASLILVLVILILNIFSKLAVKKWKVQF
jgi:phosphate transport system permease protein